jgi:hypothetical protein
MRTPEQNYTQPLTVVCFIPLILSLLKLTEVSLIEAAPIPNNFFNPSPIGGGFLLFIYNKYS